MSALEWHVYRGEDRVAAFAHPADAARFVVDGLSVRYGAHRWVVWREGREEHPADFNWGEAAERMLARVNVARLAYFDRIHGRGAAARLIAKGDMT